MTDVIDTIRSRADEGQAQSPISARPFGPIVRPIREHTPVHDSEVTVTIRTFDLLNPDVEIDPQPANLPATSTPFDIDVAGLGPTTRIRIVLLDNRFELIQGEYSITAGDNEGHPHLNRGWGNGREAEFFVLRGRDEVSFNIGMRALATNLDFYVDPKIENNG
ncbi:MAG TPA: hypothetical protein VD846_08625 [Allosphingosinicella sp.]|nr:hypothetical protein [Allosphingosinicella sp.]